MIRRPPRSTPLYSSAASDVYKRQVTRNSVIFPFSTLTFCSAIHAPRTFLSVLWARWMPVAMASSKLLGDEEMISETFATDMADLLWVAERLVDSDTRNLH